MLDEGRQSSDWFGCERLTFLYSEMLHLPDHACAILAMATHFQQVRGLSAEVRGLLRQVRGLLKSFQLRFF